MSSHKFYGQCATILWSVATGALLLLLAHGLASYWL